MNTSDNKPKKEEKVICRVYVNHISGQKLITIPERCKNIGVGDYVLIKKVEVD